MAVRLLLPDSTHALTIELAAVRWIREEYFGMEFLKLPSSDQARLAHFLSAHQRRPPSISTTLSQTPVLITQSRCCGPTEVLVL